MNDNKIDNEDIKSIQELRKEFQNVALQIGQLELKIIDMDKQKESLLETYTQLKIKEKKIAESFITKYGEGQLNPVTWEFEKTTE